MIEELFESRLQINPGFQTIEALKPIPTCKGVLLFTNRENKPIQLLIAANIRRTVRAKLSTENAVTIRKRANIAEIVRNVYLRG